MKIIMSFLFFISIFFFEHAKIMKFFENEKRNAKKNTHDGLSRFSMPFM